MICMVVEIIPGVLGAFGDAGLVIVLGGRIKRRGFGLGGWRGWR